MDEKLLSRIDEIRNALHTALASETKDEWIRYAMKHLELLEREKTDDYVMLEKEETEG